jgi:hypothetical protein
MLRHAIKTLSCSFVAGVNAPVIIHANNNQINIINDDDDGILSIATIPAKNNHDPLILPETSDSDMLDNKDQCKVEENDKNNLSDNDLDGQEADEREGELTDNQDQGVCRFRCNNKGTTAKYADYGLMINAR